MLTAIRNASPRATPDAEETETQMRERAIRIYHRLLERRMIPTRQIQMTPSQPVADNEVYHLHDEEQGYHISISKELYGISHWNREYKVFEEEEKQWEEFREWRKEFRTIQKHKDSMVSDPDAVMWNDYNTFQQLVVSKWRKSITRLEDQLFQRQKGYQRAQARLDWIDRRLAEAQALDNSEVSQVVRKQSGSLSRFRKSSRQRCEKSVGSLRRSERLRIQKERSHQLSVKRLSRSKEPRRSECLVKPKEK